MAAGVTDRLWDVADLVALTLEEAGKKLRDEYGLTATISLWNVDDAHSPRNSK